MTAMIDIHTVGEIIWTLVKGELVAWRVDADGLTPLRAEQVLHLLNTDQEDLIGSLVPASPRGASASASVSPPPGYRSLSQMGEGGSHGAGS